MLTNRFLFCSFRHYTFSFVPSDIIPSLLFLQTLYLLFCSFRHYTRKAIVVNISITPRWIVSSLLQNVLSLYCLMSELSLWFYFNQCLLEAASNMPIYVQPLAFTSRICTSSVDMLLTTCIITDTYMNHRPSIVVITSTSNKQLFTLALYMYKIETMGDCWCQHWFIIGCITCL